MSLLPFRHQSMSVVSSLRPLLAAACLVLLLAAPVVGQAVSIGAIADGVTELSAEQLARARAVANLYDWQRSPKLVARRSAIDHPLGVQTIAIERLDSKSGTVGQNRASVYQFHHGLGQARRLIVDLGNGAILREQAIASLYLPLAEGEIDFALARLAANVSLLEQLREEQRRQGRVPFRALDELKVKAVIHEPVDPPTDNPCRASRCALLALFDDSHTVFAIEPVVNLTTGEVFTLGRHIR